ncbi:hypothetical protein POTOM_003915 [Populus tomentosa]|uniref:cinnamoyl-CoA reductase n=1 Tax=Populus tomentosa TaxID=118781 RepID=A0A8X8AUS3_POPTO|nr:hypothetical protein POTOM_003915 [Populus tomentosa]
MPYDTSSLPCQDQTVCVTGAGGFIASWIVKLLLEKGYSVKGTVRNPADPKNSHLRELEGAQERLTLCKADVLDYESLKEAIQGCDGVFHTASPVTDDPEQMVEPAVNGTKNVIMAAAEAKVRRVVFTSSIGTVYMDPNRSPDVVVDESCWSDLEFCKSTKNWYCYGKTLAEQVAWYVAKKKGVDLVVVNPVMVLGPLLQPTVNASIGHILKYLTGSAKTYANSVQAYVHVRDVALAHVLVFETPSASGRYICAERMLHRGEVVEILAKFFPEYPIPTNDGGLCGFSMLEEAVGEGLACGFGLAIVVVEGAAMVVKALVVFTPIGSYGYWLCGCYPVLAAAGGSFGVDGDEEIGEDGEWGEYGWGCIVEELGLVMGSNDDGGGYWVREKKMGLQCGGEKIKPGKGSVLWPQGKRGTTGLY